MGWLSHLQCRKSMIFSKPCEFMESEYVVDQHGNMMKQNVTVHFLTGDASKRFKEILNAKGDCPNVDSELVKRKNSETFTLTWGKVEDAGYILNKNDLTEKQRMGVSNSDVGYLNCMKD